MEIPPWKGLVITCVFLLKVGHLHAGCSKEVTVTFRANQPVTLKNHPIKCKVCQVEFQQPIEQVSDWDDRQKTVQWQNASKQASESTQQPVSSKVCMVTVTEICVMISCKFMLFHLFCCRLIQSPAALWLKALRWS